MIGKRAWRDPRVAVTCFAGVDATVTAHVADRFTGLDRYASSPVHAVCVAVRRRTVPGYGDLIRVEALVKTFNGPLRASADADSVSTAVDKVRNRVCLRLAASEIGAQQQRIRGATNVSAADDTAPRSTARPTGRS
ncbi:hypothetical protein [Salinactinospora qingdaonensis]|uniref:Uncharacterized protein n=1 Tax=Salinactinospora qingdaonensis TaxID=702744 RepID=A0ABP7GJN6_9ACTN